MVSLGIFFVRFVASILGGILEIGFQVILQRLLTLFKAVSTQQTFDLKTGRLKRSQFSIQLLIQLKLQKIFYFLTCIFPDFVVDEITREFWKSSHFKNMRADFPLECQNPLRWNTPEIMHFQAWKKNIFFHPYYP